ncbi:MAG: molybdenum cofactor biosynthesis protein MoaE [Planctomycetota bacterium]
MSANARIFDGPLDGIPAPTPHPAVGAVLVFEGRIRPTEAAQTITAIDYETYDPMAERMLGELARQALEKFGLLAVQALHSRGRVGVGQCSFRLWIASTHRREGLDAMDWFIDTLKRDVPIWKRPVFVESGAGATP